MTNVEAEERKKTIQTFKNCEIRHARDKAAILGALEKRFGSEVREIFAEERSKIICEAWRKIAEKSKGETPADLIRVMWEPVKDIFPYEIEREEEGEIQLRVSGCIYYDVAKEVGIEGTWGYDLFCGDDPYIVAGFNPKMKFERTKTLMEGDGYCDHCYTLK
ncbi:MAG: L-2-amino-thiazoline-4-carboxylic acid hydrolase [Candidatus Thorarchaeota archaeon]